MKLSIQNLRLAALLSSAAVNLHAQGTAFTYQGRLNSGGAAVNGSYDMVFRLFDGPTIPYATIGTGIITNSPVQVSNGLFLVTLDFGPVFPGGTPPEGNRWLEIGVRTNGAGVFITLSPRQQIMPTPYAIFAGAAGNLTGTLPAAQIAGTIAPANIAPGTITAGMLAPGAVSMLGAPDGWPTNAVQVDNNGLVGIGTSTPAAGLQITSGANITTLPVLFEVQGGQKGWTNFGYAYSAVANGNLLAVGTERDVTLANITNPASPVLLSQIINGTGAFTNFALINRMAWAGSNLIASAWGAMSGDVRAINIISCTNPSNPVKLTELRKGVNGWNHLGPVTGLIVSGNLLVIGAEAETVSDHDAVTFADISNPSAPVQLNTLIDGTGGFTNLYGIESMALSGNLLAIGAVHGVTLVDISNPLNPIKLAELIDGLGYTNMADASVAFSGNLLAIAGNSYGGNSSAVTLMDVTHPASPVNLGPISGLIGANTLGGVGPVSFSGNRLAIGNGQPGAVTLVDVSNPASPVLLATARNGVNGADYLMAPNVNFIGSNIAVCGVASSWFAGGFTILGIGSHAVGLDSAGWVGIGTTSPSAALDVVGDVTFENATLFSVNAQRLALGAGANASGKNASALGQDTTASGDNSTALGFNTTASGSSSTAIGNYATASGDSSTAMGVSTLASGAGATAMGGWTIASGTFSTAMGYQANAVQDNTFVWSDGTIAPFSSTTSNEFSICAQNGVRIQTDKGIHLHATNAPIITRDFDVFAANAPSSKAGIGRWGLFMEANTLVMGIPGDDTTGRTFQVAKYNTNGTPATLLQVDQSGNTRVTGLLRSGAETGTSNPPGMAGLVVRRVNSLANSISNVIARTDVLTLERDGSNEGLLIRYPAGVGPQTINCVAQSLSGSNIIVHTFLNYPASAGTLQLLTSAQRAVHAQVSFGNTRFAGHVTQVVIDRYDDGTTDDNYWVGTLTSTFNQ